jgi:hypothetical protein
MKCYSNVGMKWDANQILLLNQSLKWVMYMKNPKRYKMPFIILLAFHTSLLGYSFYQSKNKKQLFTLLMSNIGLAYLLEYFVLNLFKAYRYKPRMMKKKYFDNILGAILSQTIFVPFTAAFVTAQKIGWVGKILGGVYFSLVEFVFLRLKVYKHNWWRTVYTFVLIPIYFIISDWWKIFLSNRNPLIRFISLFLMIMVTEANLLFIFASRRKIRFGLGRNHTLNEHFIIVPMYAISYSLFSTICFLKQNNWISKLKVLILTIGLEQFFKKTGLIKEKLHAEDYIKIRFLTSILYGQYRDWVYGVNGEVEFNDNEDKLCKVNVNGEENGKVI